jgi:hypothetical protein
LVVYFCQKIAIETTSASISIPPRGLPDTISTHTSLS